MADVVNLDRARQEHVALALCESIRREAERITDNEGVREELRCISFDVELAPNAHAAAREWLVDAEHAESKRVIRRVLERSRNREHAEVPMVPPPLDHDGYEAEPRPPAAHWLDNALLPIGPVWLDEPPPPREWILRNDTKPLLERGIVALFVAPGGRGKTMALCDLAISVATATPWLGAIDVVASDRVLLYLAEESTEEVRRRVYSCAQSRLLTPEERALAAERIIAIGGRGLPSQLLAVDVAGCVTTTATYDALRQYLAATADPTLLILDPLSRIAPDAESDNATATQAMMLLEELAAAARSTVMIAHHTSKVSRKDGGSGELASAARGVTALVDAARLVLELTGRAEKDLELRVTKRNAIPPHAPLPLRRGESGSLRALTTLELHQEQHADGRTAEDREEEHVAELVELLVTEVAKRGDVHGGQRALRERGRGKHSIVQRAIARAVADGRLTGGGRGRPYRSGSNRGITPGGPR